MLCVVASKSPVYVVASTMASKVDYLLVLSLSSKLLVSRVASTLYT